MLISMQKEDCHEKGSEQIDETGVVTDTTAKQFEAEVDESQKNSQQLLGV